MRQQSTKTILMAVIWLVFVGHSWGSSYTNSEFLPEYCPHTRDGDIDNPAARSEYYRIFGEAFSHMHHYCRGLARLNEAAELSDNNSLREGKYRRASIEFNYVLDQTNKSFVLRPEILVKKGMALLAVDNVIEAVKCFREAVLLRPDYVPAYVALSNYLLHLGDEQEARRVLEAGLSQAPNNPYLQEKLSQLAEPGRTGTTQHPPG